MRILTWNVRKKIVELDHPSILSIFDTVDVLALTEIGTKPTSPTPRIPGFTCITHTPRPHSDAYGGVACFVRDGLAAYSARGDTYPHLGITSITVSPPGHQPAHIVCVYLPHQSSVNLTPDQPSTQADRNQARDAWFDTLQTHVDSQRDCQVVVCGDFNARTGAVCEVSAQDDWSDLQVAGIPVPTPLVEYHQAVLTLPVRRNMDTVCHAWGRALLAFARSTGLVILNGRLPGDAEGTHTFYGSCHRRSTIDYFLAAPHTCFTASGLALPHTSLRVTDHSTLPSDLPFDHTPVTLSITLPAQAPNTRTHTHGGQRHTAFCWNRRNQLSYFHNLMYAPTSQSLLSRVMETDDCEVAAACLHECISAAASATMRRKKGKPRYDHQRHKPWFDSVCKELRAAKLEAEQRLGLQSDITRAAVHRYWQHIKTARRAFAEREMVRRAELWTLSPQAFWSDFQSDKDNGRGPFTLSELTTYFSELYASMGGQELTGGSVASHTAAHSDVFPTASAEQVESAACLNAEFTLDEVETCIKKLHNGRAAGADGLCAEFIKRAHHTNDISYKSELAPHITRLFNVLLTQRQFPRAWTVNTLSAVPKSKGQKDDLDSYRGIAVGNALAKLYSMVLLSRLDRWAEVHGVRARGQAGFRPHRGTADNVFVLSHVTERARHYGRPVYCAFIDFRKAYDSINRDLLWEALQGMGVHGSFLDSLKQMYGHVEMRVKLDGRLGRPFAAPFGVKQGDPLSPLLFGLYMDRLEQYMLSVCRDLGARLTESQRVSLLLYADDLVLLAESPEELQRLLDALHSFTVSNHMTVNVSKSAILACGDPQWRGALTYAGEALPTVPKFTYLGVDFYASPHRRGHAHQLVETRLEKATKVMHVMKRRCRELGLHNVSVLCKLFDSLCASVMNYGCELWSVYQMCDLARAGWGEKNACEILHRTFLRSILQVRKSTPSAVLMNECVRLPVMHAWCKRLIGWWNRTVVREDEQDLVLLALKDSISDLGAHARVCWGKAFMRMVCSVDPALAQAVSSFEVIDCGAFLQSLSDKWHAHTWGEWQILPEHATNLRSVDDKDRGAFKLATYRHYVCTEMLGKGEGFTPHVHLPAQIKILASFRLGSHDLNIERQRHAGVVRSRRWCTCCALRVREDELHILECPAYSALRSQYSDLPFPAGQATESDLRRLLNPDDNTKWPRVACFLSSVMRERTLCPQFIHSDSESDSSESD